MKRKFRKVVIVFIDILGSQNRKSFDEWYEIMNIFSTMVNQEKELDKAHEWTVYKRNVHIFSDCAYIVYDYKEGVQDNRKDIYELMTISCYNTEKVLYEFLKNGFIVRGAITFDDLFYDNETNIWFGPAMNRAFFLESKKAKFPRVIIDPKYGEELYAFNEKRYRKDDLQRIVNGEILRRDEDGFIYLNYLNSVKQCMNPIEDKYIIAKILRLCGEEKARKRETKELQESIREKYDWLEKYLLSLYK